MLLRAICLQHKTGHPLATSLAARYLSSLARPTDPTQIAHTLVGSVGVEFPVDVSLHQASLASILFP